MARLLSSEIKGDLLILFHKNPGIIDTIDGVARRIGRTGDSISQEAMDLVDLGVLKKRSIGKSEVLSLNRKRDREIQEVVTSYLKNLGRS